jgi:hypothetical protein
VMFDAEARKDSRGPHDCIKSLSGSFWSAIKVRLAES